MNNKLRLIIASNGIQVFAATLLIPVFALFTQSIGGGPQLAGILFGISFLTTAVVNLIIIRIHDRKLLDANLYKVGMIVKAGAWTLLAIHQSIAVLVITQIILGLSDAIGSPSFNSLMSGHLDKQLHISEWSRWDFIQNIATGAASVLSGYIIVGFGFASLFSIMAAITLIALLTALRITDQKPTLSEIR